MSDAAFYDSRHLDHIPFPVLIGDIGGTNARFAVVHDMNAGAVQLPSRPDHGLPDPR
jgi:hypothetical protein